MPSPRIPQLPQNSWPRTCSPPDTFPSPNPDRWTRGRNFSGLLFTAGGAAGGCSPASSYAGALNHPGGGTGVPVPIKGGGQRLPGTVCNWGAPPETRSPPWGCSCPPPLAPLLRPPASDRQWPFLAFFSNLFSSPSRPARGPRAGAALLLGRWLVYCVSKMGRMCLVPGRLRAGINRKLEAACAWLERDGGCGVSRETEAATPWGQKGRWWPRQGPLLHPRELFFLLWSSSSRALPQKTLNKALFLPGSGTGPVVGH